MLADVLKEKELQRQKLLEMEKAKYDKPIKRDTILYYAAFHTIGGIETWIYNLAKKYEFSVVYDINSGQEQLQRLRDIGVEVIWNVGQEIECNTLISCLFGNPDRIKAKKRYFFIHCVYNSPNDIKYIPKHDEIFAVSKVAADRFEELTGIKPKIMYNPIDIEIKQEPLILGVFSRLSREKGGSRVKILLDKLISKNKPFLMLLFTDRPLEYIDERVVQMKPTMEANAWISKCDYICVLSDTEACPYVPQEALKLKKPLIITRLPILEEFGINDSNAKILEFDMSNLDIEDLWNKPVVKNWKEPISKEWEDIMKKKVFREKHAEPEVIEEVKEVEEITEEEVVEEVEEEAPKTDKKKVKK